MEVALGIDRFGGGVGPLVVFLEQHCRLHQHLAVVGDLDLDAGRRLADAVELDLAVRLQADVGAGFGLAVELLEVDADRAVEAEQVGADRRTGGVGHANAAHAQHIAQGAVDQQIAQPYSSRSLPDTTGLAVEDLGAATFGHAMKIMEHLALERRRPPCGSSPKSAGFSNTRGGAK
jgi:hypothetical protein